MEKQYSSQKDKILGGKNNMNTMEKKDDLFGLLGPIKAYFAYKKALERYVEAGDITYSYEKERWEKRFNCIINSLDYTLENTQLTEQEEHCYILLDEKYYEELKESGETEVLIYTIASEDKEKLKEFDSHIVEVTIPKGIPFVYVDKKMDPVHAGTIILPRNLVIFEKDGEFFVDYAELDGIV